MTAPSPERVRVLLIEDDDGDALDRRGVAARRGRRHSSWGRARSLAEADLALPGVSCVLLDLELPDSRGLQGVRLPSGDKA